MVSLLLFLLFTEPAVFLFTLSALVPKLRVGKALAQRLEKDSEAIGTADTFTLSWLAQQL